MVSKRIKQAAAVLVLTVTIAVFVRYTAQHPEILKQLALIPLHIVALLLALYAVFQATLVWIQRETLKLCNISLGRKESTLLVMYSAIINFFGPLQSGPAFRAAYLKRKYNINLKQYTLATLMYYFFYATFSGVFLVSYFLGFWALGLIIGMFASLLLLRTTLFETVTKKYALKTTPVFNLASATLAQVSILAVIFYVGLQAVGQSVQVISTLIYTAAANFALFISLTPGAIGFREAFLVFTGNLHHIPNQIIVSANLVDRGVYILFLGILVVITTVLHAGSYLRDQKSVKKEK